MKFNGFSLKKGVRYLRRDGKITLPLMSACDYYLTCPALGFLYDNNVEDGHYVYHHLSPQDGDIVGPAFAEEPEPVNLEKLRQQLNISDLENNRLREVIAAWQDWYDNLNLAMQADGEHGVRCLNERAATDFRVRYPATHKALSQYPEFEDLENYV